MEKTSGIVESKIRIWKSKTETKMVEISASPSPTVEPRVVCSVVEDSIQKGKMR